MPSPTPPYTLRIPQPLRSRLEAVAGGNKRSLHAEILDRLEASLSDGGEETVASRLSELQKRLDAVEALPSVKKALEAHQQKSTAGRKRGSKKV